MLCVVHRDRAGDAFPHIVADRESRRLFIALFCHFYNRLERAVDIFPQRTVSVLLMSRMSVVFGSCRFLVGFEIFVRRQ